MINTNTISQLQEINDPEIIQNEESNQNASMEDIQVEDPTDHESTIPIRITYPPGTWMEFTIEKSLRYDNGIIYRGADNHLYTVNRPKGNRIFLK